MLWSWTRGGRMEGTDKSTELWRHPYAKGYLLWKRFICITRKFCLHILIHDQILYWSLIQNQMYQCRAAVKRAEAKSRLRTSSSPMPDSHSPPLMASSPFKPFGSCMNGSDKNENIFSKVKAGLELITHKWGFARPSSAFVQVLRLWPILYAIGQILIVETSKILKNNLSIWSHCITVP